jgi:hypothetical protein
MSEHFPSLKIVTQVLSILLYLPDELFINSNWRAFLIETNGHVDVLKQAYHFNLEPQESPPLQHLLPNMLAAQVHCLPKEFNPIGIKEVGVRYLQLG